VVPIVLLVSAGRWERTRAHTCVHARAGVLTRKQFPPARKTEEVEVRRMHARNRHHPGPSCTDARVCDGEARRQRAADERRLEAMHSMCAGFARCRTCLSHMDIS